jgi:SAM-dependent methyltransferase
MSSIASQQNNLTKEFYEKCAKYWNNNPEYEWVGWKNCLELLPAGDFGVTDLGCGSGRFGFFLEREFGDKITEYVAVDYTDFYTELVNDNKYRFIRSQKVYKIDLFAGKWGSELAKTEVVVGFGLLHHLPKGFEGRFFTELYKYLKEDTICILTTWQYKDNERLTKKILDNHKLSEGGNDNVLSWTVGEYGERFSHHWTVDEVINTCDKYNLSAEYLEKPSKSEKGLNNYFSIKKLPST